MGISGNVIILEAQQGQVVQKLLVMPVKSEISSMSYHPDGSEVAVGFKEKDVRIYFFHKGNLTEKTKIEIEGEISFVSYSPDGQYLAVSASRKVRVLSTNKYQRSVFESEKHTARVTCLGWSPDSKQFASASLDSTLKVYPFLDSHKPTLSIKAQAMSYINRLAWLDTFTIITAGQDSNVKKFVLNDRE